ncbi:MAG: DUF4388 domain-containing protein [Actinomycetota bacterium]|nr:DUF4388 domain-containing protein [Actinomycetota bacterium]
MLRGSLDDFGVEDVLWLVDRTKKTGELIIERPAGRGRLFFRDGFLYAVESELAREPLHARLVRTGLITPDQLRTAQQAASDGSSVARTLVANGFVAEEQLVSAAHSAAADATFELMRREFGDFAWEADAKTEAEVEAPLSVRQVVEACASRAAVLEQIKSVIPSDNAIPSISKNPSRDLAAITITSEQWRLLALMDGRRSIADIAREARLADFTVMQTLHDLAARSLLQIHTTTPGTETVDVTDPAAPTPVAPAATKPFTIVLLCTANRIRSPMAESFLRAHLGELPATVESVGVDGREGQPAMPEAVEVARELGGDLSAHAARPLSAVDLSQADLILGFEARHVRRAVRDGNAPPEKTFTLPQFVKCIERAGAPEETELLQRARTAVELAHAQRSDPSGSSRRTREIEIVDPLGGPISAYRNTALRIRELCKRVSEGLFGTVSA